MDKITRPVEVNGQQYELQQVSPKWYLKNYDLYGRGKDTTLYVDGLIRNAVVSPEAVREQGIEYFESRKDTGGACALMEEIERFLGRYDNLNRF